MGSRIDSSRPAIRESTTGGSPLLPSPTNSPGLERPGLHFTETGGCSRKESEEFCPAVADVYDEYRALLALPAPQAPQAPQAPEVTGSSSLDLLYALDFQRLELELEAFKALQRNVPLPKVHVHERNVPALKADKATEFHVPSSVTEGNVPELGVVGVKAEGELVFGSELVEQKAGLMQ